MSHAMMKFFMTPGSCSTGIHILLEECEALFYVEFWADKTDIELPENCNRHYQQMLKRPAVRQVLAQESYHLNPQVKS